MLPGKVLVTAPTMGSQSIAIAPAILSTIASKEWMWEPFYGHSLKQENPRCPRL